MRKYADKNLSPKKKALHSEEQGDAFQLHDQRKDRLMQQNLQELANNSMQVHQLRTLQERVRNSNKVKSFSAYQKKISDQVRQRNIGSKHTVQLALIPGRLNIVGEYHNVSDKRREKEKLMTQGLKLGKYFQESEYQTTFKKKGGMVSSVAADPARLRIKTFFGPYRNNLLFEASALTAFATHKTYDTGLDFLYTTQGKIIEAQNTLKNTKNDLIAKDNKITLKACGDIFNELVTIYNRIADLRRNLSARGDKSLSPGEVTSIVAIFTDLKDLKSVPDHWNKSDSDVLKTERSNRMHKVGNKQKDEAAIWKVGNAHVNDIKGYNGNYALTDVYEFDQVFQKWLYKHYLASYGDSSIAGFLTSAQNYLLEFENQPAWKARTLQYASTLTQEAKSTIREDFGDVYKSLF
jgi:hypothetical protein